MEEYIRQIRDPQTGRFVSRRLPRNEYISIWEAIIMSVLHRRET